MTWLIKGLFIFFILAGVVFTLNTTTQIEFGHSDFFDHHGLFFLIFITLFPRLTLFISAILFNSIEFGGLLWWCGFILAPRLLVSILATISYWNTNPFLVVLSWMIALSGESTEKYMIKHRLKKRDFIVNRKKEGPVIDAEYTVKE